MNFVTTGHIDIAQYKQAHVYIAADVKGAGEVGRVIIAVVENGIVVGLSVNCDRVTRSGFTS